MMTSRLDITQIFWDVDDFCNQWSRLWQKQKQLPSMPSEKRCCSRMSLTNDYKLSCISLKLYEKVIAKK